MEREEKNFVCVESERLVIEKKDCKYEEIMEENGGECCYECQLSLCIVVIKREREREILLKR